MNELFQNTNSGELDIEYIINIVQDILDKNHTDPRKKEIKLKLTGKRELNINCPICGDGAHVKFRGHLFLKNLMYICYNERESDSMSFMNFCKHFNIQLDPEKKLQLYNHINENVSFTSKDDFVLDNLNKLLDAKEYITFLNNKSDSFLTNISTVKVDSAVYNYLINRKITNFNNILQGIYHIKKWKEPVLIILNRSGNKLIGFQIRNLKDGKKRFYKEHEFEFLYNYKNNEPLDELEFISYNKLSHIFNVLNVNFDLPVNAFEGYLDSVFFPNSISLLGLDTDTTIIENENIKLRFVFDNDASGLRKAKQFLEKGKTVFLWKKLFDDLIKNDYTLKTALNDIKDMNQLVILLHNPNIYNELHLEKYFSRDRFDIIYLEDKPKNKKIVKKIASEWDNIIL
jgi:hypothetical protein